jgi:hypothetical protein
VREFINRIIISAVNKNSNERKIHIIYNFIGAFDFATAIEQSKSKKEKRRSAILRRHNQKSILTSALCTEAGLFYAYGNTL